jgi:predicted PurR-regulated permease PerM
MNRLKKYYKEEYTRIAVYVVITALVLFISCLIVLWASGQCGRIFTFISAVLTPLVLGIVLAYLLSPVVTKLEKKLAGNVILASLNSVMVIRNEV